VVTPRRPLTKREWAGYILTLLAAALCWVAVIFSLRVGVPLSGSFLTAHVLINIVAVAEVVFVDTPISLFWAWLRWDERRDRTRLYDDAVRAYRALDIAPYGEERADLEDTVRLLRTVVCLLNGWDPRTECDTDGLADRDILAYWERRHPKDFRLRG
jgi:hypothetical protein